MFQHVIRTFVLLILYYLLTARERWEHDYNESRMHIVDWRAKWRIY